MRKDVTPILNSVSRPVADELRAALAWLPAGTAPPIEALSGLEASFLLLVEGAGPRTRPYVGAALAEHAKALGQPLLALISEEELRERLGPPPDLAAWNQSIGEPQIVFLLDLRRRVGPIASHVEKLYRARRGDEIARLFADMQRHRIPDLTAFIDKDRYLDLLFDRLTALLQADVPTSLVALPIDVLAGETGVLARLEAGGHIVTPAA